MKNQNIFNNYIKNKKTHFKKHQISDPLRCTVPFFKVADKSILTSLMTKNSLETTGN